MFIHTYILIYEWYKRFKRLGVRHMIQNYRRGKPWGNFCKLWGPSCFLVWRVPTGDLFDESSSENFNNQGPWERLVSRRVPVDGRYLRRRERFSYETRRRPYWSQQELYRSHRELASYETGRSRREFTSDICQLWGPPCFLVWGMSTGDYPDERWSKSWEFLKSRATGRTGVMVNACGPKSSASKRAL